MAGGVLRIDPVFNKVAERIPTIKGGTLLHAAPAAGAVTATSDGVWAISSGFFAAPRLFRIDPRTGNARPLAALGDGPTGIAAGFGHLWTTDSFDNTVTRIDRTGVVLATIPVGHGARAVAAGEGAVWVVDSLDDAVVRIDPETNSVTTTIGVGDSPSGIAIGAGAVWVPARDGTVSRIDPETNDVETITVGASPAGIAYGGGSVWLTTQEALPPPSSFRGDVARVSAEEDLETDPAQAGDSALLYATCAKLLNYPDAPAPAGTRLATEVAADLPALSRDGRTYTFRIREGFAFSPPLHERVTAETFKHAIERSLARRTGPKAAAIVSEIAGQAEYRAGEAEHISGVVARGDTLSITLVEPDPSFPAQLASPFFCAVPLDAPTGARGVREIPSAGPYYIASHLAGRRLVLKRNPNYDGPRPRRLREIVFTIGSGQTQIVDDVIAGRADYAYARIPPERDAELLARFGPASAAARDGRQQYFVEPSLALAYLKLNTSRPLFSDVRLRQAVSYAIDRRALARIGTWVSGPFPSIPTDQYLPPMMPGATRGTLFPRRGNLREARRLAPEAHGTAVLYTCSDYPPLCRRPAQLVKSNLAALGLDVDIEEFPFPELFERIDKPGEPYDLLLGQWGADYVDPSNFLDLLTPRDLGPELAAKLDSAGRLSGQARYAAYRSLSVEIAREAAPWVVYAAGSGRELFSARMGCQLVHPVYGTDLAALCARG